MLLACPACSSIRGMFPTAPLAEQVLMWNVPASKEIRKFYYPGTQPIYSIVSYCFLVKRWSHLRPLLFSPSVFPPCSLCVKGYLAARVHAEAIISTVNLMVDSGLPCFSRGDPMGNLRKRLHLEMNEREAANFMIGTCEDAYNKWTTSGYDVIQYLQQDIQH